MWVFADSLICQYNTIMTKQKVAIVEDDQAIAMMYRMKFEADGYIVETAGNGILGLALIEEMKPDIILLDLMMPEMNGDEMLTKLRDTPWGKNIKVVILTNSGEEAAPPELKKLGIRRYVVKAEMTPRQVAELVKTELAI